MATKKIKEQDVEDSQGEQDPQPRLSESPPSDEMVRPEHVRIRTFPSAETFPPREANTQPIRVIEYHRLDARWRHEIKPEETVEFERDGQKWRGTVVHKNQDGIVGVS